MENGEEDVDLNMAFNLLAMQPSLMSCSKQNWMLISGTPKEEPHRYVSANVRNPETDDFEISQTLARPWLVSTHNTSILWSPVCTENLG